MLLTCPTALEILKMAMLRSTSGWSCMKAQTLHISPDTTTDTARYTEANKFTAYIM